MTEAIAVSGLTKTYGRFHAVDGVDLHIAEGEIVAFLGPNGAGKTTTVEILEGFRPRTSGDVTVLGTDPASGGQSWRRRLGIVLQESEPIPELTAGETVDLYAGYFDTPRDRDEILSLVGLTDSINQRAGKLSGGQKRRLDLAIALVGDPDLIFLDEPTTGFDPSARRESWGMIEGLRELGRTVLLTTHYMDEAELLADRIVVIAGGRIVARGTAAELRAQSGLRPTLSWVPTEGAKMPGHLEVEMLDGRATVSTDDVVTDTNRLTGWALAEDLDLADLRVSQPTLEDVYLALTSAESAVNTERGAHG
ncbi:MAG: ABC transporter ATP-binding protein [Actinomycetota bacterium]